MHATLCYDTQLDHGRMHVSLIWPSHKLPFRTCLFNIPTTSSPGEAWPCKIALADIIYHTWKPQSGGYCVSLVDRRPGPSCAATLFFSIPLFSHLLSLLPRNEPGCTRLPLQRCVLAVLIVPLYPCLHIKLICTFTGFPTCLVCFILRSQKRDDLGSCARRISYTFRILRWLGDRWWSSLPCMMLCLYAGDGGVCRQIAVNLSYIHNRLPRRERVH